MTDEWLRKHYKGEFFIDFRYFVECYFAQGYGYDELPRIIKLYKEKEIPSSSEDLLRELNLIKERDDWDYVQKFVRKHGMRKLSHEKLKAMVDLMINELTSKG